MDETLTGKTYCVTGATSGIGLALTESLARQGAAVIGVGRSFERCREACRRVQSVAPQASVTYLTADLALQSQVRQLAGDIRKTLAAQRKEHLDGLVNNAGTFTYWLALTAEGFETQWAVNHLAPFLLTHLLLPELNAVPDARVVTVSSASHYGARLDWDDIQLRRRYNGLRAYGQTKLANVLFTQELNRRLGPSSTIRAYAADPGLVKTDIGLKGTPPLVRWIWGLRSGRGVSPEKSAQGILTLLSQPAAQDPGSIYWNNGQSKQPSRWALDANHASRLWAISEQMCALKSAVSQEHRHG